MRVSRRFMFRHAFFCACAAAIMPQAIAGGQSLLQVAGCALVGSDTNLIDRKKLSSASQELDAIGQTTGAYGTDVAFDKALLDISSKFGVLPGVGFYDDSAAPNAWATTEGYFQGRPTTVLFGRTLFSRLLEFDPSGSSILLVAAHEFGHTAQFKSGRYGQIRRLASTSRPIELHADFLAGYYVGLTKAAHPDATFFGAGVELWSIGDFAFNESTHHGTPAERLAAAEAGFTLSFERKTSFSDAFEQGIEYVSSI